MPERHRAHGRHRRQSSSATQPVFAVGAVAVAALALPGMHAATDKTPADTTTALTSTTTQLTPPGTGAVTPEVNDAALKVLTAQSAAPTLVRDAKVTPQRLNEALRASRTTKRDAIREAKNTTEKTTSNEKKATVVKTGAKVLRPVMGGRISGYFGEDRGTHLHKGLDFALPSGSSVRSVKGGVVIDSYYASDYGKRIIVKHDDGTYATYNHLKSRLVSEGERVAKGEKIALSGNTGRSTGPHLHFEIKNSDGEFINPLTWLRKNGVSI